MYKRMRPLLGFSMMLGLVACSSAVRPRPANAIALTADEAVDVDEEVSPPSEPPPRHEDAARPSSSGDTGVARACNRAVARDMACGEENIKQDCDFHARAERSEATPAYDCLAGLPCGSDVRGCWDLVVPQQVGVGICSEFQRCSPSLTCNELHVLSIDVNLARLNDHTIDFLRKCAAIPDCDASGECITGFVQLYLPAAHPSRETDAHQFHLLQVQHRPLIQVISRPFTSQRLKRSPSAARANPVASAIAMGVAASVSSFPSNVTYTTRRSRS
jgi:hypothetical protein